MKIKFFLFITLICCSFLSFGQDRNAIDSMEMELVQIQKEYFSIIFDDYEAAQIIADSFVCKLTTCLTNELSWKHPFDSLKKEIRITKSIDSKIRIFSWDTRMGGTWHDLVSYIQYKENKTTKVSQLHNSSEEYTRFGTGGYSDVIYYKIDNFEHKNGRIYLLSGYGTHGAGHHHQIMRAFQKKGQKLVELDNAFDNKKHLAIVAARIDKIKLRFEQNGLKIIFDEFTDSEDGGFAKATGKEITYAWNGNRFIQISKK